MQISHVFQKYLNLELSVTFIFLYYFFIGSVIDYDKEPIRHAVDRVYAVAEGRLDSISKGHTAAGSHQGHDIGSRLQGHVQQAISVIEECFDKYE